MDLNQTPKRPCKVITLKEKLAILKQLESGSSRREVELMFNCSQSTISRVLLYKDTLRQEALGNVISKREMSINYKELDQSLTRWAREMQMADKQITAHMAKQKAEELLRSMGHDVKPSTAWLYKWKARENIQFAKKSKEPEDILKEFLDKQEKWQETEEQKTLNDSLNESNMEERQEKTQNECLEDSNGKPRTKREYTKRLPIIDASGVIYRSRKEKTFLTLLQKLEILQRLKNGEKRNDLLVEYKLSQSAMSQIVVDEEKILKLAAGGQNLQMKRIRGGIFKGGEAELNAWVREKMENGESLTRTQIKNRAKEIAERLNIDFKASTGWLEKWKARMNLDFNENQVLQRKIPNYVHHEGEFENVLEQYEQPDVVYDEYNVEPQIKEEFQDNDYEEEMDTQDEFYCDEMNETEVKTELLTPQEFYLQTIRRDSQSTPQQQQHKDLSSQQQDTEEEQPDIKPFIGTPPHLAAGNVDNIQSNGPNLHEQVLQWLNRYHIAPGAASELLDILQPHLNNDTNTHPTSSSSTSFSQRGQKSVYF
ncbi:uncharacterized protein LOC111684340 isoform X2 [Lucilia cuprina]|uniref:uncharacterized protein LOC111684340 isoform X2 n=1 Tax=Lucilia cuprina TaxID=7375 RepID=UPI001F06F161|nr:uncharacterized protein LOC111684340 isoform X2 [Lucilia cuprina]